MSVRNSNDTLSSRTSEIARQFEAKYNERCQFIVNVPGRVNLIGEHIDYCGYSVLPMALEKSTLVAVGPRQGQALSLANVDASYPDFHTDIDSIRIVKGEPHWHSYFLCGVQGVLDLLRAEAEAHSDPAHLRGMSCLVSGTVPASAGLSSSSALVCAAAIAFAHTNSSVTAHKLSLDQHRSALADTCARSERYIGTEGGGMDQAIALLASQGQAKLIEFNPLRAHSVELPSGATFVVANSLVTANKAASAEFNIRVMECRLAAKVLAKSHGVDASTTLRLVDMQNTLKLTLEETISLVESTLHDNAYSKDEVATILGMTPTELENSILTENTRHVTTFKLKQRALHVFEEASRVHNFKAVCDGSNNLVGDPNSTQTDNLLTALGRLMSESHVSCRDLYECSDPQLDRLVLTATQGPGCYGARLTGAGWGGCMVALVHQDSSDAFLQHLIQYYYTDSSIFPTPLSTSQLQAAAFVTQAGAGASIITSL